MLRRDHLPPLLSAERNLQNREVDDETYIRSVQIITLTLPNSMVDSNGSAIFRHCQMTTGRSTASDLN
jgi:hypothetical protein